MALAAALVVEFIQPCLVRFIYLTTANRVHSLCLNVLTLSYTGSGGFKTKSRLSPNCVPLEGKHTRDLTELSGGSANDRN